MKKKIVCIVLAMTMLVMGGCNNKEREENQEAYRQIGINCMEKEDYEGALEAFGKALDQSLAKIGERELDICYYKAKAQYLAGKPEEAIKTYTALIDYDKKDSDALYLRGSLYLSQGREQEALADFAEAVKYNKKDYELYIGLYEQLSAAGKETEAQEYLKQGLEISGKSGKAYTQRGRMYLLLGDLDNAEKELKEATKQKDGDASFYMGLLYAQKGEQAKAEKLFESYVAEHEDDADALEQLADIALSEEDYEKAAGYLEKAVKASADGGSPAVRKKLIAAYESAGNFEQAKKQMAEYVKAFPQDADAARENEFLQTR